MFFPFLVADRLSGLHYPLSDVRLAELSLAPVASDWAPGRAVAETPDPVWAASLKNAPVETISSVTAALEDLILTTSDLRPPAIDALPEGRARHHLAALVALWAKMGDALPQGLSTLRHVLALPEGRFLDPLPVVEESLDPSAPAAMRALHDRLRAEFGAVPPASALSLATEGTVLRRIQGGLAQSAMAEGAADASLAVYGLRDPAACADFAAARARALIEAGTPARDIAVMTADDGRELARAFAAQGVALSGAPEALPKRDVAGETLLFLLLAKRSPTPAMALASLALSPLMPWSRQTGRDLAEEIMEGRFSGAPLAADEAHAALWQAIRQPAKSNAQLRFVLDDIAAKLVGGEAMRSQIAALSPLMQGEGAPDWDTILRAVSIGAPETAEPVRTLEGVSLWSAMETPWRPCRHLIVADFSEGLYPTSPRANPMFLDSEIDAIAQTTGLHLTGRATRLERSLALFDAQLRQVAESVTFLMPWRDMAGGRLAPSAGLALIARAVHGAGDGAALVTDLAAVAPEDWPVASYPATPDPDAPEPPEFISLGGRELLSLRKRDDGTARAQSPSSLETLIISPLAWLLSEIGAGKMDWGPEGLEITAQGSIAHKVFENVFRAGETPPDDDTLGARVSEAFETAVTRYAGFLRSPAWDLERASLARDIHAAALRWRNHLTELGATVLGNELWLEAEDVHGIAVNGKTDEIVELADGQLMIVDHKKSGTRRRRERMEAGWDLQAGLYRAMLMRPVRREGDGLDPLIGRNVGVGYHLMNDGGLLTSGVSLPAGTSARDMGEEIDGTALDRLEARLAEVGAGKIVLNTTAEEKAFGKVGITPYAFDNSPLIRHFMREEAEE